MITCSAATIERVANQLSHLTARTPKAIETRLQFYLSRTTIRGVLGHLVREGRALAEGDILQKRYRLAVARGFDGRKQRTP